MSQYVKYYIVEICSLFFICLLWVSFFRILTYQNAGKLLLISTLGMFLTNQCYYARHAEKKKSDIDYLKEHSIVFSILSKSSFVMTAVSCVCLFIAVLLWLVLESMGVSTI